MERKRKADGFENQYLFVISPDFYGSLREDALFSPFCVTDIGYFPAAQYHFRTRPKGSDENILMLCISGHGWFHIGDGPKTALGPGQAMVLPAGMAHAYAADEASPWSVYWLHFNGSQAPALCEAMRAHQPFGVDAESLEEAKRLFHRCFAILKQPYYAEEYHVVCQSAAALVSTLCLAGKRAAAQPTEKGSLAIQSALAYMKENLHQSLSLGQIAAAASFSPSHLSALFKASTGHPPMEYFLRMKMQAAGKLLFFTDRPIKEIAASFGIYDPCYFSRLFKQIMGMSPLAYRNQIKG